MGVGTPRHVTHDASAETRRAVWLVLTEIALGLPQRRRL
jgi:hypothetical protein